jgi:hypothetical protein
MPPIVWSVGHLVSLSNAISSGERLPVVEPNERTIRSRLKLFRVEH